MYREPLRRRREEDPPWRGLLSGLTLRDVAYLQSKVVDSTHDPAGKGQNGGAVATTSRHRPG